LRISEFGLRSKKILKPKKNSHGKERPKKKSKTLLDEANQILAITVSSIKTAKKGKK